MSSADRAIAGGRGPVRKVLVIKLGDLGGLVLAFPAFERIRRAHPRARITLLTLPAFAALARRSPYFDAVETDGAPIQPGAWLPMIWRIRQARFERIYDLQNDLGSNLIFQALRPSAPPWSGTAFGCALPHRNPQRARMHPLERHAEQLKDAGVWPDAPTQPLSAPPPDISWILPRSAPGRAATMAAGRRKVVLLAPASTGHRDDRRWPIENYAALAIRMQDQGHDIVIIGGLSDSALAHAIQRQAPRARDLTGRTDPAQIAALGARAAVVIGTDLGALHLAAAAGASTLALFPSGQDPALQAPRGHVTVLHAAPLKSLEVEAVARTAIALAAAAA